VLAKLKAEPDKQRVAIFDPDFDRDFVLCHPGDPGRRTASYGFRATAMTLLVLEAMARAEQ